MKLSIIIPAHNEADRIEKTLTHYVDFFQEQNIDHEFVVVLNGCTDNTLSVVQNVQKKYPNIKHINLKEAGKGLAVATGFADALKRDNDLIGFVDADMATRPQHFCELVQHVNKKNGGAIASRYMRESQISPKRPWIKEWGRIVGYNPLVRLLFGLPYKDFQCGAKLFRRDVIEAIVPQLTMKQWAFDVQLLHLCKQHGFAIAEVPTVWQDQTGSKFSIKAGIKMFGALAKLRFRR